MVIRSQRILFFQTAAQYESLRDAHPELLEGSLLVGLSSLLSPGRQAQRDGREFCPYTDYLTGDEFSAAAREAQDLSRTWAPTPAGEPADPELVEAVRIEVLQPLHELLVAQRVISRAIEQVRPGEVGWAPGLDGKIAAVLQFEAEQRGIPTVAPGGPVAAAGGRKGSGRGVCERAGRLLRSARQAAHNLAVLAGLRLRRGSRRRPLVLAFGAGVDSINQQRLLPAIEAEGCVRTLLLRAGETDSTMLNRPGRGDYPVLHFVPWRAMLRSGRYLPLCRRWWQAFEAQQAGYRGVYPFLFANAQLSPFFARLYLHLLPRALATRRDARGWLRRLRPALLLTSNDVSFPVRTMVLEARRQGIPSLGLIHSGLNNMHYRDFQSDRMAVWGRVHVRDFERVLGKRPTSLVPLGNPQYDSFGLDGGGGGEALGFRTPRVVVLTAVAQWQMLYYNQRAHQRGWQELERLPEHGIHVVIKPHPRFDDYAFYDGLRFGLADWREDRSGISVVRDAFLEEVVPTCDLAVVPNLPTTGGVEAMLLGKPVIQIMCGFDEVDCCTSIAPGCLVVREVEQIVPAILEVLGSRERQQEFCKRGQAYLEDLLGPRDRQATRRLAGLVAEMVGGGPSGEEACRA